jgi:hypothetical protein
MCLNFSAFDEDVALISSFKIMYTFIERYSLWWPYSFAQLYH